MSHFLRIVLIVLVLGAAVLVWVELKQDGSRRLQPAADEQEVVSGFSAEGGSVSGGSLSESEDTDEVTQTTYTSLKGIELIVTSPIKDSVVTSPLTITGEAPGFWYFEATFRVTLVNWDGLIIAEGYATAQGEWMTEAMVPFTTILEFTDVLPLTEEIEDLSQVQDFMKKGALILQRDNPSGLPENDDAIEFSIRFSE